MAWYDDVKTGTVATVSFVSVVVTLVIIVAVQGLAYQMFTSETERKAEQAGESVSQKIIKQQESQLKQYAWVDKKAGLATIPIDAAKELVLKEYAKK